MLFRSLAAVHLKGEYAGVAFLDISTGEFLVAEGTLDYVDKLLNNFAPKEVLYERGKKHAFAGAFGTSYFTYELEDWIFTTDSANDRLIKQFETKNLKGFGVDNLNLGIIASGAILHYLDQTYHKQVSHITSLARVEADRYVWLDRFTIRNLELFGSANENARTLCAVLDKTTTPMGGRLLRRWISFPLKDRQPIVDRLNVEIGRASCRERVSSPV